LLSLAEKVNTYSPALHMAKTVVKNSLTQTLIHIMEYENFDPTKIEADEKVEVTGYTVFWSYSPNKKDEGYGGVLLNLKNRTNVRLKSLDPNVVSLWIDLLKDLSKVYYHTGHNILITAPQNS
jgi:hypothetical protein